MWIMREGVIAMNKAYEKPELIERGSFTKNTAGLGRFLRDRVIPVGRLAP
jgi:hypothetical protein